MPIEVIILWGIGIVVAYVPVVRAFTKHGPPGGNIGSNAEGALVAMFSLVISAFWPVFIPFIGIGKFTRYVGNYKPDERKSKIKS